VAALYLLGFGRVCSPASTHIETETMTTTPPPRYHVAVDVVALTIRDGLLQTAVVQREGTTSFIRQGDAVREVPREPWDYALPGGLVEPDEGLVDAAVRELAEETNIAVDSIDLLQFGVFGDPYRDPRPGRTISVSFLAFSPSFGVPTAGSDATNARFIDVIDLLTEPNRLEFDHEAILRSAIAHLRDLSERTPIALNLCPPQFTLKELRRVYEVLFHPAYNEDSDTRMAATLIRNDDSLRRRRELEDGFYSVSRSLTSLTSAESPDRDESSNRDDSSREVAEKLKRAVAREMRLSHPSDDSPSDRLRLSYDPANFARKVLSIDGFIEEVPGHARSSSGAGKPAQLYRRGPAQRLDPPLIIRRKSAKKRPK
jgi:8-oxo-dGTP diphosphatase